MTPTAPPNMVPTAGPMTVPIIAPAVETATTLVTKAAVARRARVSLGPRCSSAGASLALCTGIVLRACALPAGRTAGGRPHPADSASGGGSQGGPTAASALDPGPAAVHCTQREPGASAPTPRRDILSAPSSQCWRRRSCAPFIRHLGYRADAPRRCRLASRAWPAAPERAPSGSSVVRRWQRRAPKALVPVVRRARRSPVVHPTGRDARPAFATQECYISGRSPARRARRSASRGDARRDELGLGHPVL